MKKVLACFLIPFLLISCNNEEDEGDYPVETTYRQQMREFVIGISEYSKSLHPGFIVIPQNGIELVCVDGIPETAYLDAIDGNGQEDLFYGYDDDNKATPSDESTYLQEFLDMSKNAGNVIMVTDYCSTPSKMDDSYAKNNAYGYISFAADDRELNGIPGYPDPIFHENQNEVNSLSQVQNFLYLINPEKYASKKIFIDAITTTNYDLIIMDLFLDGNIPFSSIEINQLRNKANGGKRLVVAYMSVGEAEDYRYYWQEDWSSNKPSWLDKENPDWEGNYKVKYWMDDWQSIIYGNPEAYLDRILEAGFDGVYLDIIDGYEYFENK